MNAFRTTILVLLAAVVGLMFYFVCVSQPNMKDEHNAYEVNKRSGAVAPDVSAEATQNGGSSVVAGPQDDRLARKRAEQERAAQEQADAEFREMERRTVEEQTRQEQNRQERATRTESDQMPQLGRVYTYNEYEGCLSIEPLTQQQAAPGVGVVIMREGRAVTEATIDTFDTETGLYFAYVQDIVISSKRKNDKPQQGDIVVFNTLPSAADLRSGYSQSSLFPEEPVPAPATTPSTTPAPAVTPAPVPAGEPAIPAEEPAVPAADSADNLPVEPDFSDGEDDLPSLPEVDAPLTPVP